MKKISKSDFIRYLECPANAWIYIHKPDIFAQREYSDFEKGLMKAGQEVDLFAREYFKEGVLCTNESDTRAYINEQYPVLYQPQFSNEKYLGICDILVFNSTEQTYDIYEVKASTYTKVSTSKKTREQYIYDVRFQKHVLEQCGVPIGKTYMLLVDNTYILEDTLDPSQYFKPFEIKNDPEDIVPKMEDAYACLNNDSDSPVCCCEKNTRSTHCHTFWYSHRDVPEYSIYDIARISSKKIQSFLNTNTINIEDIQDTSTLTSIQKQQVECAQCNEEIFDVDAINDFLSDFKYPISFLDYETCPVAIPKYKGHKPYTQIPFQFSLHILYEDGEVEHKEFIHLSKTDPDTIFAEKLFDVMPNEGSIVVWNESFELGRNRDIAERNPLYKEKFDDIQQRCLDLVVPFRKMWWVHPQFKGRTSIKYILPAVVDSFSYEDLSIRDGGMAADAWQRIVWNEDTEVSPKDLLLYCQRDTEAMFHIFNKLRRKI